MNARNLKDATLEELLELTTEFLANNPSTITGRTRREESATVAEPTTSPAKSTAKPAIDVDWGEENGTLVISFK